MKKIFISFLAFLATFSAFAQTNQRPYSFKTAYVEYELTGNTKGNQTLYIDAWGWNSSRTTNSVTKMLGQKTETNEREITKKFDSWKWVITEKKGTKIHNQWLEDLLNDPKFNMKDFSNKSLEGLGFQKTGTETINGKLCDVWKSNFGSTSWVWNNIPVKTEVKLLGTKQISTATKIEIDASVPATEFAIPADVKFEDMGSIGSLEDVMKKGTEGDNKDNKDNDDKADKSTKSDESPLKGLNDLKNILIKKK